MANIPATPIAAADLTPGAAFVVHLAVLPADPATPAAPAQGRVEHVLSGAAADFHSIADLVNFMGETLARSQRGDGSASAHLRDEIA